MTFQCIITPQAIMSTNKRFRELIELQDELHEVKEQAAGLEKEIDDYDLTSLDLPAKKRL